MGAGPERLLATGLVEHLARLGHQVRGPTVAEPTREPPMEIRTGFELMRATAARVRRARDAGDLPLVLSGNCNVSVGTVAGLPGPVGIVWFDSHSDFETPDTTESGFLDSMAVAMLTGGCWRTLCSGVPGFRRTPGSEVVLAGARDPVARSGHVLAQAGIRSLAPAELRDPAGLETAVAALASKEVYVHVDLDVLDPGHGEANEFALPGGLGPDEVVRSIEAVGRRARIVALGMASYDPATDRDGSVARAALRIAAAGVTAAARGSRPLLPTEFRAHRGLPS